MEGAFALFGGVAAEFAELVFDGEGDVVGDVEVHALHSRSDVLSVLLHEGGAGGGVEFLKVGSELPGLFVLAPVFGYELFKWRGCFVGDAFLAASKTTSAVVLLAWHIFTKVVTSS